jgi:P27 family predicted phage terminase small subunit
MARPAKSIKINSQKMSKKDRKEREEKENELRGSNENIKPFKYLNKRQKTIFKDILKNLNRDILSNLDIYLLNQTAVTIERLEAIEKRINEANLSIIESGKDSLNVFEITKLKAARDMYSKDFFRCCNELSLSPQSRAKLSISVPTKKKKSLFDSLNEED